MVKAIVLHEYGGREKLAPEEVPDPVPAAGEVLIRVKAAGVNPVDWKIREGQLAMRLPHRFPLIPGWDAAGIIAEVGEGVTSFTAGDAVYAYCRKPVVQYGTYAEYVVVPETSVALKPSSLSFEEAAAVPLSGLTAYQSLFEAVDLQSGEVVFIQAAAGGVGSFAVQLAAQQGAQVIGTARAGNHDYVLALGASRVIEYTAENYREVVKAAFPDGVDVAFDLLGGDDTYTTMKLVKPRGRMVSLLVSEKAVDAARVMAADIAYRYVFVRPVAAHLEKLATLVDAGKLRVHLAATLPLEEAARAHAMIESGHTRGKIVLTLG